MGENAGRTIAMFITVGTACVRSEKHWQPTEVKLSDRWCRDETSLRGRMVDDRRYGVHSS